MVGPHRNRGVGALVEEAVREAERRVGDISNPFPLSKALRKSLRGVGKLLEIRAEEMMGRWEPLAQEALGGSGGQVAAFIATDFEELRLLAHDALDQYFEGLRRRTLPISRGAISLNDLLRAMEIQGEVLVGMLLEGAGQWPHLWRTIRSLDRFIFNRISLTTDVYFQSFRASTQLLREVIAEVSDVEESLWLAIQRMAATRPDPASFISDIYRKYIKAFGYLDNAVVPQGKNQGLIESLEAYAQWIHQFLGCQQEGYNFLSLGDGVDIAVDGGCFHAPRCQRQMAMGLPLTCFKTISLQEYLAFTLETDVRVEPRLLDPGRRCLLHAQEVPGHHKLALEAPNENPYKRPEAEAMVHAWPTGEGWIPMEGETATAVEEGAEILEPFVHRILGAWVHMAGGHFNPQDIAVLHRAVAVDLLELGEFLRSGELEKYLKEWRDFARHLADGGIPLSHLVKTVKLEAEAALPFLMDPRRRGPRAEVLLQAHSRLTHNKMVAAGQAYRSAFEEDALNLAKVTNQFNAICDALWIALIQRGAEEGDPRAFLRAFMDLRMEGYIAAQKKRRPMPPSGDDLPTVAGGIVEWMKTTPESPAYTGVVTSDGERAHVTIHRGCPNEQRCKVLQRRGIPIVCTEALYIRGYSKHLMDKAVDVEQGELDPGQACHFHLTVAE